MQLIGTKDGLTGSASRSQDWSLDALGNWDSVTDENSTTQTRTHDAQNRIASVSGATTPTHSDNGEMTGDETGQTLWGELVSRVRRLAARLLTSLASVPKDVPSA